jgi:hypothetical protein
MRDDGGIDYSRYTLLELEEALACINKHRYPKNYANLRYAYEQLTANRVEALQPVEPAAVANDTGREPGVWDKFWLSRPIKGLGGAICLWWAYDLFAQSDSCPSGRRLMSTILKAICENFGHAAAASIPFVFGLVLVIYAVLPKRPAGA